jgi:hypothetical protein
MRKKLTTLVIIPVLIATLPSLTSAQIKDCLLNNGVAQTQFVDTCNNLAQAATALDGPPAKVTFMAACPAPAQASCAGFFGQPLTSYYYKRDPKTLAISRTGCQAQGGKWQ